MTIASVLLMAAASSSAATPSSSGPVSTFEQFRQRDAAALTIDPMRREALPRYDDLDTLRDSARKLINQQDYKRALGLLQELVRTNDQWALTTLAAMYDAGRGVERNGEKAFALFLRAAESGDARSALVVGAAYARGVVVTSDPLKARSWLEIAAESENDKIKRDAAGLLALLPEAA